MRFVYGSKERIFLNTALGCEAKCKYCYLPSLQSTASVEYTTAENVLNLLKKFPDFVMGEEGTIISIGCYSECLDKKNIMATGKLLKSILPLDNYVQLATKQAINKDIIDIIKKNRCFQEQITVYVSMPAISEINRLEEGTASFQDRINNIELCKKNGIMVALYIKPFLEQVTAKDLVMYTEIINKYGIPVIIGGCLSTINSSDRADVGEELLYEQKQSNLYKKFMLELNKIGVSYEHSTELIQYYREIRKRNNDRKLY